MPIDPRNPLIVQSDRTLLVDVHAPEAEAARAAIMPFAELEKSPEHIHTYRITPLSLWNAASAGFTPADIAAALEKWTRYPIQSGITEGFADTMSRYGKIRLTSKAGPDGTSANPELLLVADDKAVRAEIDSAKSLGKYLTRTDEGFSLRLIDRGSVKRELIRLGWPCRAGRARPLSA